MTANSKVNKSSSINPYRLIRHMFSWSIIILLIVFQTLGSPPTDPFILPIRIGLSIDVNSYKDLVISINAILTACYDPSQIYFHIVVCDSDINKAIALKSQIESTLRQCYTMVAPSLSNKGFKHDPNRPFILLEDQFIVTPFTLPADSGFALQMKTVKAISHWNSPTGADMVRFYLASIYPTVERILYIDNDVIISCCLEEIWATNMSEPHQVLGIVLDDLKWATVTQFQRQYNASHPLVIKNVRRQSSSDSSLISLTTPVSEKEFHKKLPKYPNDGVLLINVPRYNALKILETINEIALANGRGEYAVGLGTQQFTVLGMHDRWVEVYPRGNVRHFPDMARGFMMWFFYNGFLHYAGSSKPRQLCNARGNVDNEHRIQSYTPWLNNLYALKMRCPSERSYQQGILENTNCLDDLPVPKTLGEFMNLFWKIIALTRDTQLLFLKFGEITGDVTTKGYIRMADCLNKMNTLGPSSDSICHDFNIIEAVDAIVLHNSSWSGRIFHNNPVISNSTMATLSAIKYPRGGPDDEPDYLNDLNKRGNSRAAKKKKGRGKANPAKNSNADKGRHMVPQFLPFCYYLKPFQPGSPAPVNDAQCHSVLYEIKSQGHKHWDVIGISLDIHGDGIIYDESKKVASLRILRALDLEFMRPKVIIVRLLLSGDTSGRNDSEHEDVVETLRILHRNGYMAFEDNVSSYCVGKSGHEKTVKGVYRCILATRANYFEFVNTQK